MRFLSILSYFVDILIDFRVSGANARAQTILRVSSDLEEEVGAMCAFDLVVERKQTRFIKSMNF